MPTAYAGGRPACCSKRYDEFLKPDVHVVVYAATILCGSSDPKKYAFKSAKFPAPDEDGDHGNGHGHAAADKHH